MYQSDPCIKACRGLTPLRVLEEQNSSFRPGYAIGFCVKNISSEHELSPLDDQQATDFIPRPQPPNKSLAQRRLK
jgi:hypothetical protein